jgi:hypothetical protein
MPGQRPHSSQPWDDLDIFEPEPRRPDWRKPIIRVVCPVCAGIVSVNALEVEGSTDTLCSKCANSTISIATDDRGRIVSIEGWANEVEKKAKQSELNLKAIAPYAVVALIVLLLFLILLRQSGPSSTAGATGTAETVPPAAVKEPAAATSAESQRDTEEDLSKPATPTKDRLPFSEVLETPNNGRDKRANPPTGDMFAPEKN